MEELRSNHERYPDPTADLAIGRVMKEEKQKRKREERKKCERNQRDKKQSKH